MRLTVTASRNGHGDWSTEVPVQNQEEKLALFSYYTVAWFDRWLKDDAAATQLLLSRTVKGQRWDSFLSQDFRSAARLDGTDCVDLLTCAAPSEASPSSAAQRPSTRPPVYSNDIDSTAVATVKPTRRCGASSWFA